MTTAASSWPPPDLTVANCGEFTLIDYLAATLADVGAATAPTIEGIGDDAAIWTPTPATRAVITTDSLIAGVHFRLDWTTWPDLGHKALAVNLSDIAAMGARPLLATLSLGLTGRELVRDLGAMYRGLGLLAARYGVVLAGGDVVASPDRLGIHVTAIGESWPAAAGRLLTRNTARPGDLIATSGPLGLSAAGLQLLLAGDEQALADPTNAPLLQTHHRPEPQIAYGQVLVAAGVLTAMDLSDGLAGDLAKICTSSRVAAVLDETALPVPALVRQRFPDRWLTLATAGGEDYELLFTLAPSLLPGLREQLAQQQLPAPAIVGTIVPAADAQAMLTLRRTDGTLSPLQRGAFDHFADHSNR